MCALSRWLVPKVKWCWAKTTIFIRHYDRNWKTIAVIKIQNNDNLMALLLVPFILYAHFVCAARVFFSLLPIFLSFFFILCALGRVLASVSIPATEQWAICALVFRSFVPARANRLYRLRFRCPSCQLCLSAFFLFACIIFMRTYVCVCECVPLSLPCRALEPILQLPKIVYFYLCITGTHMYLNAGKMYDLHIGTHKTLNTRNKRIRKCKSTRERENMRTLYRSIIQARI